MLNRALSGCFGLLATAFVLSGCGGNGDGPASDLKSPNAPLANVEHHARAADPDESIVGGSDATSVLRPLGGDRYELSIQNISQIGGIDSFLWQPPAQMTITDVGRSSAGECTLLAHAARTRRSSVPFGKGQVSCQHVALKAPTCTCRPGGSMTVIFSATTVQTKGQTTGAMYGTLKVLNMTPVPYVIPSTPAEADLPKCTKDRNTGCVPSR